MQYTKIDMATFQRKAHFGYFKKLAYPYVGMTAAMDVTELKRYTKARGYSFYLTMTYVMATAANRIPEFRMRISGNDIIEYVSCGTSHVVLLENNTFCYCKLYYEKPFHEYMAYAVSEQEKCKANASIEDDAETDALYFVSAVPWVHYTDLVQAVPCTEESNPRFTYGKYEEKDGRLMMPLTVLAHHALIDGFHIGLFYRYVGEEMGKIISE